ncbi:MAG: hypothetical protein EPO55_14315 [Reyranella sp.]|uniref:hypothetical protein n=1 Tax=Reyranella sp. TaxID=1929291 RepID=UPI001222139E|nr:hypothetical protein [Reyranella sp.]TAJ38838.1 MAG: hypothetical protein EPO55_14315 [Reyranella sp.]
MGTFWAVWKPVALRVLKESLIPLAGGAVYGAIVGYAKQSSLDGVSAGGMVFFCLLAVQGQILRGAANARDDQPVPEAGDDFVSIRSGIEELKAQGALQEVGPEKLEDGQKALFRNLAQSPAKRAPVEALVPKQLLDLKMPYQAVLNAAVNFEREVRRRADIPGGRTVPLARLFLQPQFNLSQEKIQQLDTLLRVRNSILHGFETLVDPLEAAELVAAYDRAASWFEPPKDGQRQNTGLD